MTAALAGGRLDAAREFIAEKFGLHFPPGRVGDLERLLGWAARTEGFPSLGAYLELFLAGSPDDRQLEQLVNTLTVGETYFFRDPKLFELIAEKFIRERFAARSSASARLRVWSAGCCTGEEAYTLAILLDRLCPSFPGGAADILGTDINRQFLRQARAGLYRQWSFRNPPAWLLGGYFLPLKGDRFELLPKIRSRVKFAALNLVEDKYPSPQNGTAGMDLILCRHVLMYFTPAKFSRAVHRLAECLVEGGWLILSPAEVGHVHDPTLVPTQIGDITVHVKRARSDPPMVARHRPHHAPAPEVAPMRERDSIPSPPPVLMSPGHGLGRLLPELRPGESGEEARRVPSLADLLAKARESASAGALPTALGFCDRLLQSDKMNPVVHYLRATILQEQGAESEAERALKKVLYLDAAFIPAHLALASLARRRGAGIEAWRHLRNARSLAGKLGPESVIPESDGLTAGQIVRMIAELLDERSPENVPAAAGRRGARPERLVALSSSS